MRDVASPLPPVTQPSSGDESTKPLLVVVVASIILLISTGYEYGWGKLESRLLSGGGDCYYGYVMSIPVITLLLSLSSIPIQPKFGKGVNLLLFIWAFVGASFLTFKAPFTTTGNGYFAAWAIAYGSAAAMGMDIQSKSIKGIGSVMNLLLSSLVVIVASIAPLRSMTMMGASTELERFAIIFAIAIASTTVIFILFSLVLDNAKRLSSVFNLVIFTLLAVCWITMACFATIVGPFTDTGNGYFASWAGALMSSTAAFAAMEAHNERNDLDEVFLD